LIGFAWRPWTGAVSSYPCGVDVGGAQPALWRTLPTWSGEIAAGAHQFPARRGIKGGGSVSRLKPERCYCSAVERAEAVNPMVISGALDVSGKLSGESVLMGRIRATASDRPRCSRLPRCAEVVPLGTVGIVRGWRQHLFALFKVRGTPGIGSVPADYVGMLAPVMTRSPADLPGASVGCWHPACSLAIDIAREVGGSPNPVVGAIRHLEKGGGGVSGRLRHPSSPRPAAALRAANFNADVVFKAPGWWRLRRGRPFTRIAVRYDTLTFGCAQRWWCSWTAQPSPSAGQLIPIVVFDLFGQGNIRRAVGRRADRHQHHSA